MDKNLYQEASQARKRVSKMNPTQREELEKKGRQAIAEAPKLYVGKGLKKKSYEEALEKHLNPNPNPPGTFRDFDKDPKGHMENFIQKDMAETIKILQKS